MNRSRDLETLVDYSRLARAWRKVGRMEEREGRMLVRVCNSICNPLLFYLVYVKVAKAVGKAIDFLSDGHSASFPPLRAGDNLAITTQETPSPP